MRQKVFLAKCRNYDIDSLIGKILDGFEKLGGIEKYIKKQENILLKPNFLSARNVETSVTTHPDFIKATIKIIKDSGAKCAIGDSPSIASCNRVISALNLKSFCKKMDVPIMELKTPERVENPSGRVTKSIVVAGEIFEFDKIFNMPKLKTHALTWITVAMKNLYGLIPGLRKSEFHYKFKGVDDFSQFIVDLNMLVKPAINIVDGIVAMEGNGPGAGDSKDVGVILMGEDTVSVDFTASEIIGLKPEVVPTISKSRENRFGGYSKEMIEIVGEKLESLVVSDFKTIKGKTETGFGPPVLSRLFNTFIVKKPYILRTLCTGCGNCEGVCPANSVRIINDKAEIDYDKCIKCYCCFEVCPQKSIKLKRFITI